MSFTIIGILPIMVQRYEKRGKLQNFSENIFECQL